MHSFVPPLPRVEREQVDAPVQDRRILCVVTLHPTDSRVVREASLLAERTGAEIVLLHVLDPPPNHILGWRVTLDHPTRESIAYSRMRELAAQVSAGSEIIVRSGDVNKCVAEAAIEIEADAIFMPSSSEVELKHRIPVPKTVLRSVSCPVVLVPVSRRTVADAADL